jgi:hypothetical protein
VATHTAASSRLSLCLSVSVRKKGTGSLSVLLPSLHLAPPHCDRVPVRASCLVLCLATLCVCLGACVCEQVGVCPPVQLCAANRSLPPWGARACLCVPVPVCVRASPTLFFLLAWAWAPLSLSLPHILIHAACGGAGGGIESQLGRHKQQQQRVHCVGDKVPLGAVWMRRLRHAWGGHSERERRRRVLRRQGGVPCVSAMATKFNSAQQISKTKLIRDGTYLEYGPPLPPSRL